MYWARILPLFLQQTSLTKFLEREGKRKKLQLWDTENACTTDDVSRRLHFLEFYCMKFWHRSGNVICVRKGRRPLNRFLKSSAAKVCKTCFFHPRDDLRENSRKEKTCEHFRMKIMVVILLISISCCCNLPTTLKLRGDDLNCMIE